MLMRCLVGPFLKKKALHVELASLKERFVELEKVMAHERNQRAAAQRALVEAKMWWAREDKRVKVTVAHAWEDVFKESR